MQLFTVAIQTFDAEKGVYKKHNDARKMAAQSMEQKEVCNKERESETVPVTTAAATTLHITRVKIKVPITSPKQDTKSEDNFSQRVYPRVDISLL